VSTPKNHFEIWSGVVSASHTRSGGAAMSIWWLVVMSVMPGSYPGVVGGTRGALGVGFRLQRSGFSLGVFGPQPVER